MNKISCANTAYPGSVSSPLSNANKLVNNCYRNPDGTSRATKPMDGEKCRIWDPVLGAYFEYFWNDSTWSWILLGNAASVALTPTPTTYYFYPDGSKTVTPFVDQEIFGMSGPTGIVQVYKWDDKKQYWEDITYYPSNSLAAGSSGVVGISTQLSGNTVAHNGPYPVWRPFPISVLTEPDKYKAKEPIKIKCECGSDSVGSPKHSHYCPKWSKE